MPRKSELEEAPDVAALQARIAELERKQERRPSEDEGGWEEHLRARQKEAALAQAAEAAARRDPAVRSGAKPLPAISARVRSFHNDPTVVRDKDGQPAELEPGYHYMWVPEINQDLEKGSQFLNRYQGYGYRPVENPDTPGDPYRWNENILLRLPNETKAELVMALSPTQGVKAEDYYAAQATVALNGYDGLEQATAHIRSKRTTSLDEE